MESIRNKLLQITKEYDDHNEELLQYSSSDQI